MPYDDVFKRALSDAIAERDELAKNRDEDERRIRQLRAVIFALSNQLGIPIDQKLWHERPDGRTVEGRRLKRLLAADAVAKAGAVDPVGEKAGVVDVEFILGETPTPKVSEQVEVIR